MRKNEGVFTLYDGVLFFVFLLIASTILSAYIMYPSNSDHRQTITYNKCMETKRAIMSATIPVTSYQDAGVTYYRENHRVRNLILEMVYLIDEGISRENFTYLKDITSLINGHLDVYWALSIDSTSIENFVLHRNGISEDFDSVRRGYDGNIISAGSVEFGLENEEVNIIFYIFK